ncbi:DEAD/DEAH box helicase family protein [Nocardioides aurantiacus]|uniref:DEAD/DEAH box helicase family protein n=1 Tax=Nocardioides aurantiacus TaxID=86796 RepID=UPI000F487278|nr:DEAD/DEAH box helicase family protein [Nocardioides aurantiacus]
MLPPVPSYDGLSSPVPLRPHQHEALEAVRRASEAGSRRWWVTMPPGAGKTLVGTEVARLLGLRTLVLSPNTAITAQWAHTWESYDGPPAGNRRDLRSSFTSLTYQSLAVFDDDDREAAETGDVEEPSPSHLDRLHPHGRDLVETMREAGPLLVVLDECHHLLEVWGELLREVLDQLPEAVVLGLTATPPGAMTRAQVDLTAELFGPVLYEATIPALVAAGTLAPYAELAWLVEPTPEEAAWLAEQSTRFAELTSDLFAPGFGSTPFPTWLQHRFPGDSEAGADGPATTWAEQSTREPELADAVLRLAHAELLALPPGAVLLERHREDPGADDWRVLVDDWLRGCIQPRAEVEGADGAGDRDVLETVRRTLPAIGYTWTRRGVRTGRGTVDRVTARSRAKEAAVAGIAAAEARNLGDRTRVLVLCDHERATATTRRRLSDGPTDEGTATPEPAGSALGVLASLLRHRDAAALRPVLVTGRTVAASHSTLAALVDWLRRTHPMLAGGLRIEDADGVAVLTGRWTSGAWVGHLTRWFAEGGTQCLIGTRSLLGEGWDAPCVTSLVDLTTATTPTAVVQTRGRALRTDPDHPDKVALVWTVVCTYDGHVAGAGDWDRFSRKHRGYFTVDEQGEVVDGVAGVDSAFSEFHPPPADAHDAIDARMLVRAEDRDAIRSQWRSCGEVADAVGHVVRVRRTGTGAAPADEPRTGTTGLTSWTEQSSRRPGARLAAVPPVVAVVLVATLALLGLPLAAVVVLGVLLLGAAAVAAVALLGRATLQGASQHRVGLGHAAAAVADGLHRAGLSPVGSDALRVQVAADGTTSYGLADVDEDVSARFATAFEEVVSPMASPRYVVPRRVTSAPAGLDGLKRGLRSRGRHQPDGEVWHTVPSALAGQRTAADAFAGAWHHWASGDGTTVKAVYAQSPDGAGVLATHRGEDPFAVTCVVRRVWS